MKIRQYSCKESLKISVVAKFESDLWKTNLDIALQTGRNFICMVGDKLIVSSTVQISVKCHGFVEQYLFSLQTYNL